MRCFDYVARKEVFRESWGPQPKATPALVRRKKKPKRREVEAAAAAEGGEGGEGGEVAAAAEGEAEAAAEEAEEPQSPQSPEDQATAEIAAAAAAAAAHAEALAEAAAEEAEAEAAAKNGPQPVSVTALRWAPLSVAADGRSVFAGFSDGVVRVLWRGSVVSKEGSNKQPGMKAKWNNKWAREQVFKPHNAAVTCLAFSDQGTCFATAGKDGVVFLFMDAKLLAARNAGQPAPRDGGANKGTRKFDPLGFVKVPVSRGKAHPTSLSFRADGGALLVGLSDGAVAELSLSSVVGASGGGGGGGGAGEGAASGDVLDQSDDEAGRMTEEMKEEAAAAEAADSFELAPEVKWFEMKRPKAAAAKTPSSGGSVGSAPGGSVGPEADEEKEAPLPPALQVHRPALKHGHPLCNCA